MNTLQAFINGERNRHREAMVFDWDKAARLIKEHKAKNASAGLSGDWEYTGGEIYGDYKPIYNSYTYLASTWATPELEIDGETFDCYKMQSETPNWDSGTKWPQSALDILGEADKN